MSLSSCHSESFDFGFVFPNVSSSTGCFCNESLRESQRAYSELDRGMMTFRPEPDLQYIVVGTSQSISQHLLRLDMYATCILIASIIACGPFHPTLSTHMPHPPGTSTTITNNRFIHALVAFTCMRLSSTPRHASHAIAQKTRPPNPLEGLMHHAMHNNT